MKTPRSLLGKATTLLLCLAAWPVATFAFANVATGDVLDNVELATLDGGRARFLSTNALANVFIFFRPNQEHSLEMLRQMADCEKEFAGKPVHWVAIVSSSAAKEGVRKTITDAGIGMTVLVDTDDALYGKLGVRLHPVLGIANQKLQLVAYEPFHKINSCDRVRAKIRFALREADAAEVARSENPERAIEPNAIEGAVARRHLRMAEGYVRMQQWDKAADEARKVLEDDAGIATGHSVLGDALAGQGRCEDAARAYAEAVKLDPALSAAVDAKRAGCTATKGR